MPASSGGAATGTTAAGYRVNAYDLAGQWLRAANLPDTTGNRKALAAWFFGESARAQGSSTDIIVYGNNPLNITGAGSAGSHGFKNNPLSFATYSSTAEAATSWTNLLKARPEYKGIYTSFSINDQQGFLAALAKLRPGEWTNATHVRSIFNAIPDSVTAGTGRSGGGLPSNIDQALGIVPGTVITQDVINQSLSNLDQSGLLNQPGTGLAAQGIARGDIEAILQKHIGETWSPTLAGTVQSEIFASATQAGKGNIPGLVDLSTVNQFLANITSPANWLHIGGILGGVALIAFGGFLIIKDATFGGGSQPTVAPIVIKETT